VSETAPGPPTDRPLTGELRALFAVFAALALVAGFLLFVLSEDTDRWFSWDIAPPLTAAFLGASYWAAFVLLAWTARRRTWARARATVVPVGLIAVLLAVATWVHLEKFDLDSLFGWFWLCAYTVVPPALIVLVWRQLRVAGSEPPAGVPVPSALLAVLGLQAVVILGVGSALYAAPATADDLWPWPLTPLTARAVGAFVIGFGAAAAWAVWDRDLRRLEGSALAYATLGALALVAALRYSDSLGGPAGVEGVWIAFTAGVLAVGVAGSILARRSQRA
jgi:hypothetical protein